MRICSAKTGLAFKGLESGKNVNRSDEALGCTDGGEPKVYVSGAHDGGRLVLWFEGPVVSGALPRGLTDAGCAKSDFLLLYLVDVEQPEVVKAPSPRNVAAKPMAAGQRSWR